MRRKGYRQSGEWIQKRVASRKGYHPSQETLMKMRESKLGNKNPMFGKHWSEKSKAKWKLSRRGYAHTEETKQKLRKAKLLFYQEYPEAIEQFSGKNNPMFGRTGALNPMFGRTGALNPMFGKHLSVEARMKLSSGRRGKYKGVSNPFYGKHHSEETRIKMKQKWVHRAFPEKGTRLELKIQQALMKQNISFQKQAQIPGRPDIFIRPNICIFIDGCYWHGCPCKFNQDWTNQHAVYIKSRMEHDVRINKELHNAGFIVLRFKEHEINGYIENCVSQILERLKLNDKHESN